MVEGSCEGLIVEMIQFKICSQKCFKEKWLYVVAYSHISHDISTILVFISSNDLERSLPFHSAPLPHTNQDAIDYGKDPYITNSVREPHAKG